MFVVVNVSHLQQSQMKKSESPTIETQTGTLTHTIPYTAPHMCLDIIRIDSKY